MTIAIRTRQLAAGLLLAIGVLLSTALGGAFAAPAAAVVHHYEASAHHYGPRVHIVPNSHHFGPKSHLGPNKKI